jgi:hypothetical protein
MRRDIFAHARCVECFNVSKAWMLAEIRRAEEPELRPLRIIVAVQQRNTCVHRVQSAFERLDGAPEKLGDSVKSVSALFTEVVALTGGLYEPRFRLSV